VRIDRLSVYRVREVESLLIDVGDRPMVAVLGKNGTGKSTVLACIVFALSGEVMLDTSKADMVRDVGEGDSWVTIEFTHRGESYRIKRNLSSSSCVLTFLSAEDRKPIRSASKVNAYLAEVGLPAKQVVRAFMPQGGAYHLFSLPDGERMRFMTDLFELGECSDIHAVLGEHLKNIHIDPTVKTRHQEVRKRFKEAKEQLKLSTKAHEEAKKERDELEDARQVIERSAEERLRNERQVVLTSQKERCTKEVDQLSGSLEATIASLKELGHQVEAAKSGYERTRNQLLQHAAWDQGRAKRTEVEEAQKKAEAELNALLTELAKLPQVDKHRWEAASEQTRQAEAAVGTLTAYARTQQELVRQRNTVLQLATACDEAEAKVLSDETIAGKRQERDVMVGDQSMLQQQIQLKESGICPTCKQPLPGHGDDHDQGPSLEQLQGYLNNCVQALAKLEQELAEDSVARQAWASSRSSLEAAQQAEQRLLAAIAELPLSDLDVEVAADGSTDVAEHIQGFTQAAESSRAWLEHQHVVNHQRHVAEAKVESLQDQITRHQEYLAEQNAQRLDEQQLATARKAVDAFEQNQAELNRLKAVKEQEEQRLDTLRQELKQCEAELEAAKTVGGQSVTDEELDAAKKIVEQRDRITEAWEVALSAFNAHTSQVEELQRQEQELKQALDANAINQRKYDILYGARWLVHSQQLQRYAASYYCEVVNQQWSTELARMEASFTAWQDPETLEFHAKFHETGNTRKLRQLSGGERQLASIGYQLVINRLFAHGLGWIAFDEPTTHVDDTFRPRIATTLANLRDTAPELEQIWVVDHSVELGAVVSEPVVLRKTRSG